MARSDVDAVNYPLSRSDLVGEGRGNGGEHAQGHDDSKRHGDLQGFWVRGELSRRTVLESAFSVWVSRGRIVQSVRFGPVARY